MGSEHAPSGSPAPYRARKAKAQPAAAAPPNPDTIPDTIPLDSLFGKPTAAAVTISPLGRWLAWLSRGDAGVLDLWVATLPLSGQSSAGGLPGARRLTAVTDGRDVCFTYRFTRDDRSLIYLRETKHGSELYHPHACQGRTWCTPTPCPFTSAHS